jgi:hypothetical protein
MFFSKAKTTKRRPPAKARAVYDQAGRVDLQIRRYLVQELRSIRADISIRALTDALVAAREADIFAATDVKGMRQTFKGLAELLEQGAEQGAATALTSGEKAIADRTRAKIKGWVKERAPNLVGGTIGTSRKAILKMVKAGVEAGRHPARLALDVQSVVGLTEPQVGGLLRYRSALEAKGGTPARINALVDKRSERLLERRAADIAKTESFTAVNAGRSAVWESLMDEGVMPDDQLQEWDASMDGAVCETCAAMHGQRVKVGESFVTPDGESVSFPALHSNCRCVINLAR